MISDSWKSYRLGDVVELKRGYDLPRADRRHGHVPIISSSGPSGYHDEAKVSAPGVVTGRYGTIGEVFYVLEDYWPLNTSLYVRDFKGNDPRFIYYFLKALDFHSYNDKSSVPGVNRNHLHQMEVSVPNLDEQRRIAAILGSLDDKIEHNRRTAQVLERLARAIFKAWFIDFEPVKAKAEGATSFPSMPQDVFDALPTTFVDTEIVAVPEGWGIRPISRLASLSKDQLKPIEYPDEAFDHFSLPAFDAARRPVEDLGGSIKSNKFIVKEGSVLLSKLNPRIPRVWLPPSQEERRQIASTEFLVFEPYESHDRSYLYLMFTQRAFQEVMVQQATGTSTSHQRVKPKDLLNTKVVSAPVEVRRSFDALTRPILKLVGIGQDESDSLAQTRDYLLPKLMSGAVPARDEAAVASEVA